MFIFTWTHSYMWRIGCTVHLNFFLFPSIASTLHHIASRPTGWLHRHQLHLSSLPLLSPHIRWVECLWGFAVLKQTLRACEAPGISRGSLSMVWLSRVLLTPTYLCLPSKSSQMERDITLLSLMGITHLVMLLDVQPLDFAWLGASTRHS